MLKQLEQADVKAKNAKLGGDFFGAFASIIDKQTVIEKNIYEAKSIVLSTFPIPNTKEDILEFLALSVGQIKSIKIGALEKFGSAIGGASGISGYKINYKNAWLSIANRVIMKARFSMKADKKTLEEIEGYAKELGIK